MVATKYFIRNVKFLLENYLQYDSIVLDLKKVMPVKTIFKSLLLEKHTSQTNIESLRILLVTDEDPGKPYGGLGTFVRNLSKQLKTRHDVRVLFLQSPRQAQERGDPSGLVDWTVPTGTSKETQDTIDQIVSSYQPHVIHCNDQGTWEPFQNRHNVVFSLHLSIPDLVGLLGLNYELWCRLEKEKKAVESAAALVVYSQYYRERVLSSLSLKCSPLVLPLGGEFSFADHEKPNKGLKICFFGRLVNSQKGVDEFAQGVALLDPEWVRSHGVSFHIYGHSSHTERYNRLKTRNISTVEFLQGEALERAYQEAHVVVMPSKYEPFGLVGLEAMSAGSLLLADPGLGMDEYFKPGINGLAIESTPESIQKVIYKVVENWEDYKPLARQGQIDASHWTWERCSREHEKVYYEVENGRMAHRNASLSTLRERAMKTDLRFLPRYQLPWEKWASHLLVYPFGIMPDIHRVNELGEAIQASGEYLEYPDNSYDAVTLWGTLVWSTEPRLSFKEAFRVTRSTVRMLLPLGIQIQPQFWSSDTLTEWMDGLAISKESYQEIQTVIPGWILIEVKKHVEREAPPGDVSKNIIGEVNAAIT